VSASAEILTAKPIAPFGHSCRKGTETFDGGWLTDAHRREASWYDLRAGIVSRHRHATEGMA
jgi:hypothetical protein